jgi:outer membrane receptor protein involved in Fe transport
MCSFKTKFLFLLFFYPAVLLHGANSYPARELRGVVREAGTSEPIVGAMVLVKGTSAGAITDGDGYFCIRDLAEEKYTLTVSYIAHKTVEMECRLEADTTMVEITMEYEAQVLDEVVVGARLHGSTESGMVMTVRSLPQVTSGVSAAQIDRGPDRVAAEVIRRVSGVTVIDDRLVIVRGLSQRYNNAWINGLAAPSTETDSRAFPFDLIPGSQIESLLVYKSPSPEIPADFSGGFIKITSKSVPDGNRMEVGYTTGFNVRTQFRDFRINPGSGTDFLGFDGSKRPFPADFPGHLGAVSDPDEISRLTREGFNNDWRIRNTVPLPDQRLSWMIARRMETKKRQTVGNMTALTYGNTFKGVEGMKNARYGIYSAEADRPVFLDDYSDDQFSNDVRLGVLHNWSFVPNASDCFEFKNLLNITGRNRLTERTGIKDMSSMYYREQTEMLYSSRSAYSGQFSGRHNPHPNRSFDWDAGYAYAAKDEPDRRIVTNQAGISNPDETASIVTGNDNISRYFQNLRDHNVSVSLNYRRTFAKFRAKPTLKAGLYGEYRNRDYALREFIYRYDRLSFDERQVCLKLPFQEIIGSQYPGADKIYIDEITRKTNAYQADVEHAAGYAAMEITLGKLLVYGGVRFENHRTKLTRDRSDAPEVILMTTKKINDRDLLPSLNLNYKFTDNHQLRAAYGRSLNRPELRELSPSVYFDFDLFSEIGGNENLKTALIDNLDLRYEFYPGAGETVSLGVFYKHFKNPIEWTFIDMGGSLRYNYENAARAQSWGIELDLRIKPPFLEIPGFSLTLNVALIESNVHFNPGEIVAEPDRNMQGQSPYVINSGLFYQSPKGGLHASLLYNRIGKRIVGLGKSNSIEYNINALIPDSYEMPRNTLDFTVGKNVGKGFEIRFSVKDILSEDVIYKQFPKFEKDGIIHRREQITRQYNPGQSVSLGISYKINRTNIY